MNKSDIEGPGPAPYREVPAPPSLRDVVGCFWEIRIPAAADARVRIVPNGCVDIVLYASETSVGEAHASRVGPPHRSFVVGTALRHFFVQSTGWRHVIGISLLPAGVRPILGLPARLLTDQIVLLDEVIGSRAAALEEIIVSDDPDTALARVSSAIESMLASEPQDAAVSRAVASVRAAGGQVRVDALAELTNLSARQLDRRFLEVMGIGPKTLTRLVRFDAVVRDMPRRGNQTWSQFALAHGYSDQAHFIREFQEFAGVSPEEYLIEVGQSSPPP